MKWIQFFSNSVLERGLDYYKSDRVKITKSSNKFIEAKVSGYHEYNIRINFTDAEIESMYCDCPFEGNCKHLAACLYYLDENPIENRDIVDLLSKLSNQDLKEFLFHELSANEDLLNKLKLFANLEIDDDYYINKLYDSFDSSFKVLNFIDEDISQLIKAKKFYLIFKLCDILVVYLEDLNYGHKWDAYDNTYIKLEKLLCKLSDLGCKNEIKEFLAKVILSSEDEGICDGFSYIYSKFGDSEELFE